MKTIGLIGGMSWESSAVYYQLLNQLVKEKLGGFHSCKSIMVTVDMAEIAERQHDGRWDELGEMMAAAARQLEAAGADVIVLCTNTMHLCADAIRESVAIPFLHIAEATGKAVVAKGLRKVALLGTRFTMEKDFSREVLRKDFEVEVLVPELPERQIVHDIIYEELVHGQLSDSSRERVKAIIADLAAVGAEGVVLGCTELPLLIKDPDVEIPVFSTMDIHAAEAVDWALAN